MKVFYLFLLCLLQLNVFGQKNKKNIPSPKVANVTIVSYEVLDNGDTINKLDSKNQKQGNWIHQVESRYGEEGYFEYGAYVNNVKQGPWSSYDTKGTILSQENYKNGNKDGEARYYENGRLYCVANYLALRSQYAFDTIMVEQAVTNELKPVIIRTQQGSVRHGFWTYYHTYSGKIAKLVEYQVDDIIYEKDYDAVVDSTYIKQRGKNLPHVSATVPDGVWILDKSKKPNVYTDLKPTPVPSPRRESKLKKH